MFSGFGGETKGDLIAELKLSHTIGGVGKLRSEQVFTYDDSDFKMCCKKERNFTRHMIPVHAQGTI